MAYFRRFCTTLLAYHEVFVVKRIKIIAHRQHLKPLELEIPQKQSVYASRTHHQTCHGSKQNYARRQLNKYGFIGL